MAAFLADSKTPRVEFVRSTAPLSTWGKSSSFESAKSFLTHAPIQRPACLLLDVRLPDFDGLALQEKLVENDSCLAHLTIRILA